MPDEFDMTIHISTGRGEVVVEQKKAGGVITHKHITPQGATAFSPAVTMMSATPPACCPRAASPR